MILIRFALISLIVYLIIRSLAGYAEKDKTVTGNPGSKDGKVRENKKISKKIGEYIDYEDVGK
jgi:hypothetical protein